ncbi:hypothetical protein [Methylobacterium radiotolerans]
MPGMERAAGQFVAVGRLRERRLDAEVAPERQKEGPVRDLRNAVMNGVEDRVPRQIAERDEDL